MGISPEVSEERCLYNHRGGTSALSQSTRFLPFSQKFSHKHKLLFVPAIILASNPSTGSGWKDSNMTGDQMFEWNEVMKNGYSAQDIIISKENHTFQPIYRQGKIVELFATSSNQSVDIQTYYLNNLFALAHILNPKSDGVIGNEASSTLDLHLNNSVSNIILINDPKIAITTSNHGIVPRLFVILEKGGDHTFIILKVKSELYPFHKY